LFYAPGLTSDDVSKEFQMNQYISEVNFLIDGNKSSIELATAFWFTPQACHENQITTINRYSFDTRRWENSNFYPNKYQNFHGCIIEVLFLEGGTNLIGAMIFATLSAELNFQLNRTRVDFGGLQNFHWNFNLSEVITFQNEITNQQSLSPAIFFDALTFVVPPGEPLTDLEKMFAAFDEETWIAIGATFLIALVVIQVIKRLSVKVQNFVFGRGIRSPVLNLVDIFLNGGQNQAPERNFARYLLMLFVIWSLIFRTCYQSIMFEQMNSDMRRDRITTIDELKAKNFTLIHGGLDSYYVERFASE
jgi:hypothetical protein